MEADAERPYHLSVAERDALRALRDKYARMLQLRSELGRPFLFFVPAILRIDLSFLLFVDEARLEQLVAEVLHRHRPTVAYAPVRFKPKSPPLGAAGPSGDAARYSFSKLTP